MNNPFLIRVDATFRRRDKMDPYAVADLTLVTQTGTYPGTVPLVMVVDRDGVWKLDHGWEAAISSENFRGSIP